MRPRFTGDSLFPGGPGNTEKDPQRFSALMDDLQARVFDVYGDSSWVHPGHGKDTTLGAEPPSVPGGASAAGDGMTTPARYDAVADFYEDGFPDAYDDSATAGLLDAIGPVTGLDVLDLACGHGRISRELARRGGRVLGIDISGRLIERAEAIEQTDPLGLLTGNASSPDSRLPDGSFDLAVCCFGLSDIDDLNGALATVARCLRPSGRFVFSILHPCFPGGGDVSGSWPATGSYYDEGRWTAEGARSTLRGQVGANHRMLSTYFDSLTRHRLGPELLREPPPPPEWAQSVPEASRHPVFLVASCRRGDDMRAESPSVSA